MIYDVFISYSRKDMLIAEEIRMALEGVELTCFTDRNNIPPGVDYETYIYRAIKNSKIFLYVASKNSADSTWSSSELNVFLKGQDSRQLVVYVVDDYDSKEYFLDQFDKKFIRFRLTGAKAGRKDEVTDIGLAIELLRLSKNIRLSSDLDEMSESENASKSIFICHSHEDKEIAQEIYNYLTNNDVRCWLDVYSIPPGIPYAQAIMEGLKASDCLVVLYSKNAVESHDMLDEIQESHTTNKRIIPFLLDDTPLVGQFRYYLARRQWITAYPNYKDYFEALLQSLHRKPKSKGMGLVNEIAVKNRLKNFIEEQNSDKDEPVNPMKDGTEQHQNIPWGIIAISIIALIFVAILGWIVGRGVV